MNWTPIQSIRTLEMSRAFRFRPEERGALLGYLGIAANSRIAEIGCGTGVFTAYLAAGIPDGLVLGIDATPEFVAFANERRGAANIDFALGDAYALPLAGGAADATTSYTLLAILREPAASLREQARVVRKGGTVSAIEVVRAGIGYAGRPHATLPEDVASRLAALRERWNEVSAQYVEPLERERYRYGWHGRVEALPLEFERAGLRDVRLRGFLSTFSTSDETYSRDERRWFLEEIGRHEIDSIEDLWSRWSDVCARHGIADNDRRELQALAAREQALRLSDFDDGHRAWAWHATANLIIAGTV